MQKLSKFDLVLFRVFFSSILLGMMAFSGYFLFNWMKHIFTKGPDIVDSDVSHIDEEREVKEYFRLGYESTLNDSEFSMTPLELVKSEKVDLDVERKLEKKSNFYEYNQYPVRNYYILNLKSQDGFWVHEDNTLLYKAFKPIFKDYDQDNSKLLSHLVLQEINVDTNNNKKLDEEDKIDLLVVDVKQQKYRVKILDDVDMIRTLQQVASDKLYIRYQKDKKVFSMVYNLDKGQSSDALEIKIP